MNERKHKILVVTSTFPRWHGDTEPAFVYELCHRLLQQGFSIDILAPHASGALTHEVMAGINVYRYLYCWPKWEKLTYSGGILANLKTKKLLYLLVPLFMFFQTWAIFVRLRKKQYDVVHAHSLIPQGFTCAVACRIFGNKAPPVLCTSHGGDLFALQSPLLLRIKYWTIKRIKVLTVVSEYMRRYCESLSFDLDKVSVCSMGVDLYGLFKPVSNVERKNRRLLFVGRLVEKKGVSHLLDAVKQLIEDFPDVELLIAGDGPERKTLQEKAGILKIDAQVSFYGAVPQEQLPQLYSSAEIAVIPSIIDSQNDQEGLGLVTIEAMGCGCAVVASSLQAITEVIEDKKTGLLVESGNVDELARAIAWLLTNTEERNRIAKAGREAVCGKYDWNRVAEQYRELLLSI